MKIAIVHKSLENKALIILEHRQVESWWFWAGSGPILGGFWADSGTRDGLKERVQARKEGSRLQSAELSARLRDKTGERDLRLRQVAPLPDLHCEPEYLLPLDVPVDVSV